MITFDQAIEEANDYIERHPVDTVPVSQRILLHAVLVWMKAHGASDADTHAFIRAKVDAQNDTFWDGWDTGYDALLRAHIA